MARTIVIGDVHGCRRELERLLERLAPVAGDALCFVGDLIARGPDSRGVLELVTALGARLVRGNHEWKLLAARRGEPVRLGPSHAALLRELEDRHWATLEGMRAWIDFPEHDLRVVHAGVVPGLDIDAHDPWVLAHVRTLRDDGTPSDKRDHTLWGKRYRGSPHVVFGHNAVDGLQLHASATGIDTGCVYGGRLTALVLGAGAPVPPSAERGDVLVAVPASRAYVDLRPGA